MAPSVNGNGYHSPLTSNSAVGKPTDEVTKLWTRFEATKYGDSAKNQLIEDLITRYEDLLSQHKDYVKQSENASTVLQERDKVLESSVIRMQKILNRDPHILVLIDGDGLFFSNLLLRQGAAGGKEAAALLSDAITEWATATVDDYPADSKVVVRVYANLRVVADTCAQAGFVEHFGKVEDFARGFTCSDTLFDFVDVGNCKGGTQGKISEMYQLFLYNYHCRQIVLGCTSASGYVSLLDQHKHDEEALPRVALLEGAPFNMDLANMPFRKLKLAGIFQETKNHQTYCSGGQRVDSRISLNATSEAFTPRNATPVGQSFSVQSPPSSAAGLENARPSFHARTDSITSSGNNSDVANSTWATVISKNKLRPLADTLRRQSVEPAATIKRNRAGQRIDVPGDYDRDEVQRIKKLKGCNQHYIGAGCCHYNAGRADKCPHNHHFKFSAAELKTLRVVAKETPCKRGHDCDDVNCIYGHMCPFPSATVGSMRGSGCLNGNDCRFPISMHDMDTVPVRTVRATGTF
ncbi:uncharacterized protein LTR77_007529 [Saxophila tyrrhenica]|uniref:C-x8-C-x5-C-x3-H type zinc finger protein n=1 Tax=Saxophila tyrrhenica TaxID=1690608 RepID=A0AAV9P931_9PEZI|nr:hypothetical protein LTR77_007529 [Saxophila tyrrhenica]